MPKPLLAHEPDLPPAIAGELRVQLGRLMRRLREQANMGDITPSQRAALLRLQSDGPATATQLAEAENMRPQSMGAIVTALEAAGLVSGAPDPADGRKTILSLTPACLEWVKAGRAAREDWLSRAMQQTLSTAEQQELARAVQLLKRLADA
jgi:DNA-binding MarR family transcriptional regulator